MKFTIESSGSQPGAPGPEANGRGASSTILATSLQSDPLLPTSEGDLRETFDLPLMMGAESGASPRNQSAADAVALFRDRGRPAERLGKAEARSKARRCPTCGGVVPAGMSICSTCGLDLETGNRVDLEDDLDAAPPVSRGPSLPIGIGVVGGTSFLVSLILTIVSFSQWLMNQQPGFQFLGLVCLFGVYASVQFLRGKSAKLLLIALSLGALVDIVALIALPIWWAHSPGVPPGLMAIEGMPEDVPAIKSYVERFNEHAQQLTWGIALLLVYAATVVYLSSPGVRRHFMRQ